MCVIIQYYVLLVLIVPYFEVYACVCVCVCVISVSMQACVCCVITSVSCKCCWVVYPQVTMILCSTDKGASDLIVKAHTAPSAKEKKFSWNVSRTPQPDKTLMSLLLFAQCNKKSVETNRV